MKAKRPSKEKRTLLEEQQWTAEKIGERLKTLRKAKGHSSAEKFAFENNIDRSQYGKYERGQDMQITTLVKLLYHLEIPIDEFFGEGFGEK